MLETQFTTETEIAAFIARTNSDNRRAVAEAQAANVPLVLRYDRPLRPFGRAWCCMRTVRVLAVRGRMATVHDGSCWWKQRRTVSIDAIHTAALA